MALAAASGASFSAERVASVVCPLSIDAAAKGCGVDDPLPGACECARAREPPNQDGRLTMANELGQSTKLKDELLWWGLFTEMMVAGMQAQRRGCDAASSPPQNSAAGSHPLWLQIRQLLQGPRHAQPTGGKAQNR